MGVGSLEKIKEEVYLSKGAVVNKNNVQDHNAIDQLLISPTSSQLADIARNLVKSSGTEKTSSKHTSQRNHR